MSFQSQLLGATASALNAVNDKEYKDSVEQFNKKEPDIDLEKNILDLKEKTLRSDMDYTKKDLDAIQANMHSYDEQGKEYDDVKSISGESFGDLAKKRLQQINELNAIQKQRKEIENPPQMSIDESVRKGYIQAKALESEDKNEKENDKSKDIVSDMFKQSTEYINAQTALEKQRLLRRRRNGNNKSN